jgi:hypothetical protein
MRQSESKDLRLHLILPFVSCRRTTGEPNQRLDRAPNGRVPGAPPKRVPHPSFACVGSHKLQPTGFVSGLGFSHAEGRPPISRKTKYAAKPRSNPAPAIAHPPELPPRQCSPQADLQGSTSLNERHKRFLANRDSTIRMLMCFSLTDSPRLTRIQLLFTWTAAF